MLLFCLLQKNYKKNDFPNLLAYIILDR